jgi:hypothetical protein
MLGVQSSQQIMMSSLSRGMITGAHLLPLTIIAGFIPECRSILINQRHHKPWNNSTREKLTSWYLSCIDLFKVYLHTVSLSPGRILTRKLEPLYIRENAKYAKIKHYNP